MIITKNGYEKLNSERLNLVNVERPKCSNWIEESRTMGSLEDNPEFMAAMSKMTELNKKIDDLTLILNEAQIYNPANANKDYVGFGATITIKDVDTNKKKKYTIVSMYESDIENGLISIESPLGQNLIGMEIGDDFEFNNKEYVIENIEYNIK